MMLPMLYAKLHRATVTACELHYNGSMGIDKDLLAQAGLRAGQRVDVLNATNGERFSTYLIEESAGSKAVGIYGAAARKAMAGDVVIVIAYAEMSPEEADLFKPKVLLLGEGNVVEQIL